MMNEFEKINLLRETFKGRADAYGAGSAEAVKAKVSDAVLRAHIQGKSRVGIYPLTPEQLNGNGTWWIAADIDINELGYAAIVAEAIDHLGIPCYVERSKSKGYHVWVFFSELLEAKWARAIIYYASSVLERDVEAKIYEMFPKQNTIKHTDGSFGYGNYINLPLFGADVPKEKTIFLDALDHYKPYPDQWTFLKSIRRATPEQIKDLIEMGELSEESEPNRVPFSNEVSKVPELDPNKVAEYYLKRALTQADIGKRNDTGFWLACQLRDLGLSETEVEPYMRRYAQGVPQGEKLYTEKEAQATLKSAYEHPQREPAIPGLDKESKLPKRPIDDAPPHEDTLSHFVEENELLPAFKDVHGIKVFPSLPEIAWRGVFADFRDAHTNTTEASDEFLFASILTATGAILGRRGWMWYARRLYPNFYSCIVGVTARSRKTTAAEKAIDLLQRCDPNVLYYSGLASAEGFINLFSALYEKEEAEIDARIEAREIAFEQAPAKYRAQKIRLSEGVANYEGVRLLCYIPEFSGLLKKAGKESSAGLTEMLIAAYDNRDKLDNPTRTSPLSAINPSCSLITTTTIGRLLRALTNEETEGGFTNRFSYFIGDRKGPNDDPPEPDFDKLNRVVQKLVAARRRWANTRFQLHPQARQLWKQYYDEWFYQNENDVIDPITGRLPDQIRKLSLQYAMVENTVPEISPEQMEAAIVTGRYWHECICVLFKSYGLTESQQTEQQILEACANGGKSKTELYKYFQKHIDSYKLNQALENLQKVGRIIVQNKKRQGSRKSTPVFRLIENVLE